MGQTIFYVEKDSDQMRSTLKAIGLARLVDSCTESGSGAATRIKDEGSVYTITINRSRDQLRNHVATLGRLRSLLPAILKALSAGERKELDAGGLEENIRRRYQPSGFTGEVVNYEAEKQKADNARADRKSTRDEGDRALRDPKYPLWAHLCSYFGKGSAMRVGYPLLIHAWHAHRGEASLALFDLIFDCYTIFPNDLNAARDHWLNQIKPTLNYDDFQMFGWKTNDADVSALSVVSPSTAQGSFTNNGARTINTGTPETFWSEMYLAFVGFMLVAMPYNADGDVLLYYPLPHDISIDELTRLMEDYRKAKDVNQLYDYSNLFPRAKIDVINQLNFCKSIVAHYREARPAEDDIFGSINAISGIVGYYYKDISTQVPFDETTFALPAWLPLDHDGAKLTEAETLLDAHLQPIRALRGDNADELLILDQYRRFATLGDLDNWINFAFMYSQYRFHKLAENPRMPSINLEVFEKTIMNATAHSANKDYRPILANPGFQSIAAAINQCTVYMRWKKDVKKLSTGFKVRHGLGDDLRRNAHNADQFIQALADFIQEYQQESVSVQASTGEKRGFISFDDLTEVVGLVQQYGAPVVASLLVAAGYASHVKQTEDGPAEVSDIQ